MEIERKFLIKQIPENLQQYTCLQIEQAYLCVNPVVRIRRQNKKYFLTCKSHGLLEREEYNIPIDKKAYEHLIKKADGKIISKKRYEIPIEQNLKIELDIFEGIHQGLILAEVEFPTRQEAEAFQPPDWFLEDVTFKEEYHNSCLSQA